PVGTGPFKVDAMAANRWRLSAHAGSWRPPQVDKLELLVLPDASSRVQALEAGRVDVALVIGPDNIEALEAAGARVETFITATTFAITLRTTAGGPLADVRVRKALNHAINRERIVASLLAGRTVPSGQPGTRGVFGHDPELAPYPYDLARAKALLAEAGYSGGFAFTLDAATSSTAADASVFQQVQADLREVGVTMTINTMPYPLFLSKTVRTEFEGDAFPISWAAWPTLDTLRAMEMHSCLRLVPWFCDPALVPVMKQALAERDEARALALRRQVARALHDQATGLLLYELPVFVGLSPQVRDFTMVGYRIFYDRIALAP
ncbi:MAG: ABC transporter substrate-binding protein, partial [Rhodospirillaceae bacterium]|nr:ABC transporter substrate-binding protein [Rhodospirillaceae bacterium]